MQNTTGIIYPCKAEQKKIGLVCKVVGNMVRWEDLLAMRKVAKSGEFYNLVSLEEPIFLQNGLAAPWLRQSHPDNTWPGSSSCQP